jgi:hypothetical protein
MRRSAEEGRCDKKYPAMRRRMNKKMETQYAEAKGELLVELKLKTTTTTVKDLGASGARIDFNVQGEVKGKYNGVHMETISMVLKPDGTSEGESKGVEFTRDGDAIFFTTKGRSRSSGPTTVTAEGTVNFQTPSPKLSWLNSTKGRFEATANMITGEIDAKIYANK